MYKTNTAFPFILENMALNKPYKRIYREMIKGSPSYLIDSAFSPDRFSYIHSYHLIENDLKELFDYISPHNLNLGTFSHRIYELFFRCCTEFENNAKVILNDNGYIKPMTKMKIKDYFKINNALKLNEYEARLNLWDNGPLVLKPYIEWNSTSYVPLSWWQDYNSVKHNRSQNLYLANLENLINAIAGILIILYAQYAYYVFSPYQIITEWSEDDGFITSNNSIFEIKPATWSDSDKYDFDWKILKSNPYSFDNYVF